MAEPSINQYDPMVARLQGPKPPMQPKQNPFDLYRERARQQAQGALSQNMDAMRRRFAQLGGGPTGAQIKMEQQAINQNQSELQNQLNQISAQEIQNTQDQDFKNKVFDFEQANKERAFGQAERQQRLEEQGQLFNQTMATLQSAFGGDRYRDQIAEYIKFLDKQVAGKGHEYTPGVG